MYVIWFGEIYCPTITQIKYSQASIECQPRGLVYTDVIPFQQEELRVCPFDPNNKIQYSQLKGPSNNFPMQLTSDSSLQMKSHSAGMYTFNTIIMYAEYYCL